MYPIMGGGDVEMWHNHIYVQCTLIWRRIPISKS